jgi:hypothetical protein
MKKFKKFLVERRFTPYTEDGVTDADMYGDHKKLSPKEFGDFIKTLTEKAKKDLENYRQRHGNLMFATYGDNVRQTHMRQMDYHMATPHLTDEHFHEAVPHLLDYGYEETLGNLDIPWHVIQPHAELQIVAHPSKSRHRALTNREHYERNRKKKD